MKEYRFQLDFSIFNGVSSMNGVLAKTNMINYQTIEKNGLLQLVPISKKISLVYF